MTRLQARSWSPTAARSRCACSAPRASSASARVAVYSEADRDALHVRRADDAYLLGPGAPAESYLNQDRVFEAAPQGRRRRDPSGLRLPGRERVLRPRAARRRASPGSARRPRRSTRWAPRSARAEIMLAAGVPIVPGTTERVEDPARVVELGEQYGWPIALKAAAGGGGKGLKVVAAPDEAERALEAAQREGQSYFGDPAVYVEKYLLDPRHVEVQLMADTHGTVVLAAASATARCSAATRRSSRRRRRPPSTPEVRAAHRRDGDRRRAGRRLRRRRHHRVPDGHATATCTSSR